MSPSLKFGSPARRLPRLTFQHRQGQRAAPTGHCSKAPLPFVFVQIGQFHSALFRIGKTVEQGRRVDWSNRFTFHLVRFKCGTECSFDQLGAIFLDGGFGAAQEFVSREFGAAFSKLNVPPTIENPKGELQELLQARSPEAPEYHVVSVTGPDHDRVFDCVVQHGGVELARGSGKSKKAAESAAALAALKQLREEKS